MHRALTRSLGSLPEKDLVDLAVEWLRSPSPVLRAAGVDVLRRLKLVARSEDLGALISDPDREVRRKALDALLEMDGDAAAAALGRLSTVNNQEDRRRLVASLERTASLKPIPILLERLKRLEAAKRNAAPPDVNPEREDAAHVLGRLASRLGAPQPRPAPLSPAAVRLRCVPEDPASGAVLDGSWGKSPTWAHRRGTALFLDLGEARTVHSIVALKDGGWPLLYASEDELAYAWCAKLGPSSLFEHVLVDVKARHLKIEHSRTSQDDGRVRELFVYTVKGEGVLAAWEAWWKALEPRLAGYDEARPLVVEARGASKDDPEAFLAKAVELVKKHPGLYVSYQARAEARLRTGDVEGAVEDARRGLALAPEAVGLRAIEAEAHLLARRWDEAREAAGRALAEAPGDPRAHAAAARAAAGKGENERALEDLFRAVLCGFDDRANLESDALLAPLRAEKRFAEILDLLR
jgi:tetratricopeptide (TPR) repeat protein